jgi:hypothetical protein
MLRKLNKTFKLNEVLRDWKNKILDTIWIQKQNKNNNYEIMKYWNA